METLQKECQLLTNSLFEVFKNRLVYLSFDIETGGEYCGTVQISCQKIHPKHCDKEYGVLGMVKIKFLEVKIQNLTKWRSKGGPG